MYKWIVCLLLVAVIPCWGKSKLYQDHAIKPMDVLHKVELFRKELNNIRLAMKKSVREDHGSIRITGASPYEVFFQAKALLQNTDQLSYEIANSHLTEVELKLVDIYPKHVFQLVSKANKKLELVKKSLNFNQKMEQEIHHEEKEPSDVFNELIKVNGDLNHLLQKRLSIEDIYREVTLSVNYMSQILRFVNKEIVRIPEVKEISKKKYSRQEIYQLLMECITLLKSTYKLSSLDMLTVRSNSFDQSIENNELYVLSNIIVAEVYHFYFLVPEHLEMIANYQPDVSSLEQLYHRILLLKQQLDLLHDQVKNNPNWLKQQKDLRA